MRAPSTLLIPGLIANEVWRRFSRRVRSGPLYRWRFVGSVPEKLNMAPQDLRPADSELANDFYAGHFTFAGATISTGGESPFSMTPPGTEWHTELHSFRWLRHLRAAESDLIEANASAFVADWIEGWGNQLESDAWRSDITAARMISWFSHAPLLVKNSNPDAYRRMLKSLARQTRYLHHNAPSVRDGYPRLHAMIALAFASLCLSGREKTIKQAARELDKEIERQILADGGHISRNPIVILHILTDLLPLRQVYQKQGLSPSPIMLSAIDRMMGALRFFQHSNGALGQFNGTGATPAGLLSTILRYDSTKSRPSNSAPHSGYERLAANKTVVLMDTGKPISRGTARRAMAGTLSFELSSGNTRFIANCGATESGFHNYAPFSRATAAHSTATVDDVSSSSFAGESKIHSLLPSPLIRSPQNVTCKRTLMDGFDTITATHDGYLGKYGIIHSRQLQLSEAGNALNGLDWFIPNNAAKTRTAPITIRFHLPPSMSVSHLSSGHSILIAAPGNTKESDAWTFTCIDAPISLEESIQFSGPGNPRKSEQIVLTVDSSVEEVRWAFVQREKKADAGSKSGINALSDAPNMLPGFELEQQET